MYLTVKQTLKHLKINEYKSLRDLCHISKNLVNEAIYEINKNFEKNHTHLLYKDLAPLLQNRSINYSILHSNIAQQIIKKVEFSMFGAFFKLLNKKLDTSNDFGDSVNPPKYLKKKGFFQLVIQDIPHSIKSKMCFKVPFSKKYAKTHEKIMIRVPSILKDKTIKEIRIVPKQDAKIFEVQYSYVSEDVVLNHEPKVNDNTLAIDLGINNFATCVSSKGDSFIIDGKKLKSYNQWYNKYNAKLQIIKSKQHMTYDITKKQANISYKRHKRIDDFMHKAVNYIIEYCLANDIQNIVLGYNDTFKDHPHNGKANNQTFMSIPFTKFKYRLEYKCYRKGIRLTIQEESYTSKASFFDNDYIPVYHKDDINQYVFSGKRVKRGLYKTSKGILINADLNGALNILKKSNAVPDAILRLSSRGVLNPPVRIRIHK